MNQSTHESTDSQSMCSCIEEEDVFLPATPADADDVQAVTEDLRRGELHDATIINHTTVSTSGLLSVHNGCHTATIPTICVREEIETDT